MIKIFLLSGLICLCTAAAKAQVHKIYDERIRSLQVVANEDWLNLPVISLQDGKIDIDFDDLTHQYERYIVSTTGRRRPSSSQATISMDLPAAIPLTTHRNPSTPIPSTRIII